ncbi:MAG: hypothetical protein ACRBCS_03100 [Cellvibrionaceae bacterium]
MRFKGKDFSEILLMCDKQGSPKCNLGDMGKEKTGHKIVDNVPAKRKVCPHCQGRDYEKRNKGKIVYQCMSCYKLFEEPLQMFTQVFTASETRSTKKDNDYAIIDGSEIGKILAEVAKTSEGAQHYREFAYTHNHSGMAKCVSFLINNIPLTSKNIATCRLLIVLNVVKSSLINSPELTSIELSEVTGLSDSSFRGKNAPALYVNRLKQQIASWDEELSNAVYIALQRIEGKRKAG